MRLINVMASTLDGRIGLHSNEGDEERTSLGISSSVDQAFLRGEIEKSDAIVVGATSVRANGRCLEVLGSGGYPSWFILARKEIPEEMPFWEQREIHRTIVSPFDQKMRGGVENIVYSGDSPALELYKHLKSRGFKRVLLFGGGIVNAMFYKLGLVDELRLSLSPMILGMKQASYLVEPSLKCPERLVLQSSISKENFVFLNYKVIKPTGTR